MIAQARRKEGPSKLIEEKKTEERALDTAQGVSTPPAQMQFLYHRSEASQWSPMDPENLDLEEFAANSPISSLCSGF